MRLQMAIPWNAVIAASKDIAEQYMEAFGLTSEMWEALGYGASPAGRQFDRIVVIRPHWQMDAEEIARFEQVTVDHWITRLGPGGHLKII
jgi:hypothetical protein